MSARKLEVSPVRLGIVPVDPNCDLPLCLPAEAVRVRSNGIEFHYSKALAPWTEAVVRVCPAGGRESLSCAGVVVSCDGSPRTGYHICMVLIGLAPFLQQQLVALAHSQLS